MAEDCVSLREFGRQIGRSHVWVQDMVNNGSLPCVGEGRSKKIPIEAGFEAVKKLIKEKDNQEDENGQDKSLSSFANARNVTEATNKARLKKEIYTAQLKELEYKLRNGDLVERSAVIEEGHAIGAAMRQQLMSLPVRVAGLCEGRTTREIEEILEDAINDALTVFQKSEFFKK